MTTTHLTKPPSPAGPAEGLSDTLTQQVAVTLAAFRQQPVVYRHASPADQCLLTKTSSSARRTYLSRLNQIARLCGFELAVPEGITHRARQALQRERYRLVPWHALRYEVVTAMLATLRTSPLIDKSGAIQYTDPSQTTPKTASYQTVNVTLAVIKDVARQAFLMGQMTGEDLKRIELVKGQRGHREPAGRHLPEADIAAVIRACEEDLSPAGCRDAAIVGLLHIGGLRRYEVAGLAMADLDMAEGKITITGKGNKTRVGWPDAGTWRALEDWLLHRGYQDGPLFQPVNRGGNVVMGAYISDQTVYNVVIKRVDQAALAKGASPHDFRRSFVTNLLQNNNDINTVRELAGHASVNTTALYDRRPEHRMREAQRGLSLPYTGQKSLE